MKAIRVLIVWGSETNCTKNVITEIADGWKADGKIKVVKVIEGDAISGEFDQINSSNYDALIVATSSYGDGDPPAGFGKFLYKLYEASKDGEEPFAGMQHAVLGLGSTTYETYQNVPRLVDKLIGEAGSKRCLKRVEVDEVDDDNEETIKKWSDEVVKAIGEVPGAAPVCDWTEPADEIYDKVLGEDGFELAQGMAAESSNVKLAIVVAALGAGYFYYKNYIK